MKYMPKFNYDDIVRVNVGVESNLRPGERAWIVGITPAERRLGSYYEKFPDGVIYTIEFEGGDSIDVHEDDISLDARN